MPIITLPWPKFWTGSAFNCAGEEMEQVSRAGDYRHRTLDDWMRPTPWQAGPHPIAAGLREKGQTETQGFKA